MSSTKVIHRFIRSANLDSNVYNRVANRFSPFTNTLVTLTDPATERTLHLIGTTNASTTLAHRTRLLLETVRPDAVYVQASQDWWNYAQHVDVPTQQLFTLASKDFPEPSYKF
jgi:ABC-type transporter Mla subunit MlaD